MTATATQPADITLDQIVSALRRGNTAGAEEALLRAGETVPPEALARLAELNMKRRRWADAAWLFDHAGPRDPAAEMKRCLSRNLAALEVHRPAVYANLVNLPTQSDVTIAASATGRPTIVCRRADGVQVGLSPNHDPVAGIAHTMARVRPALEKGQAIGLCGVGDGYLLHALSRDRTPLFCGMEQPVFVPECDPQVALHCLMIHDYAGPDGPIEQPRFFWFVGPNWDQDLEAATAAEPFVGCPSSLVGLSIHSGSMQARVQEIASAIVRRDEKTKGEVERYYASLARDELVAALTLGQRYRGDGPPLAASQTSRTGRATGSATPQAAVGGAALSGVRSPRRPRVLLLTTRFSTVLQYSTRDAADAFDQLGWDARVLIEPSPAHRLYRPAIRRALAEFKPDLLLQIDHLRHEHGDLFPPNLPFACWIQDHLPNLQNARAGVTVGARDFVLTDAGPLYAARHGYLARQFVALPKLTRVPRPLPRTATIQDGDDLVFVSNASHAPARLAENLRKAIQAPPEVLAVAEECAARMIAVYADGECLPTFTHVACLLREVQADRGLSLSEPALRDLAGCLTHPLNDALYRQQAVRWAIDVAREMGLTLALYGNGWDRQPEFAPYARGPVQYGAALEELTRRSRINLQIVPFTCLHQRLLDGLVAGGFFLVRSNPSDTQPRELLDFLERHAEPWVRSVEDVRAVVAPAHRAAFERIVTDAARLLCNGVGEDPVACVRASQEAGLLVPLDDALPRLAEVSFDGPESLRECVTRFIAEPGLREELMEHQRAEVVRRFSYESGMRRVVGAIGTRIADEADDRDRRAAPAALTKEAA